MARKVCKCVAMSKLMELLGAAHAAAMHKKMDATFTSEDWLLHFDEEEEYVLPHLPANVRDKIYQEHQILREEIRLNGRIVSGSFLDNHAEYEDNVVIDHLGYMLEDTEGSASTKGLRRQMLIHRANARGRTLRGARML